ncbi:hypothetical protein C5S39_15305 [Candidatus Methanophagaceae archaeon]|nr:hypothetical protein C5S39_15305 [Methanophagales archaeon]
MAKRLSVMENYWKIFWTEHAGSTTSGHPQRQVLRTLHKKPISEAQFQRILKDIEEKVEIWVLPDLGRIESIQTPVNWYLVSWIVRIRSLKNSMSRKPYACLFITLILLFRPSRGPVEMLKS